MYNIFDFFNRFGVGTPVLKIVNSLEKSPDSWSIEISYNTMYTVCHITNTEKKIYICAEVDDSLTVFSLFVYVENYELIPSSREKSYLSSKLSRLIPDIINPINARDLINERL